MRSLSCSTGCIPCGSNCRIVQSTAVNRRIHVSHWTWVRSKLKAELEKIKSLKRIPKWTITNARRANVKSSNNKRYNNQPNIKQATKITSLPPVVTAQAELKRYCRSAVSRRRRYQPMIRPQSKAMVLWVVMLLTAQKCWRGTALLVAMLILVVWYNILSQWKKWEEWLHT